MPQQSKAIVARMVSAAIAAATARAALDGSSNATERADDGAASASRADPFTVKSACGGAEGSVDCEEDGAQDDVIAGSALVTAAESLTPRDEIAVSATLSGALTSGDASAASEASYLNSALHQSSSWHG